MTLLSFNSIIGSTAGIVVLSLILFLIYFPVIYFIFKVITCPKGGTLHRSHKHRIIAGVCGGIAERCDMTPLLVRFVWIVTGIGFPIYVLLWFIMPDGSRR